MSMMKVNVGGAEYPCRVTMGAMLRFKRETGRDISDISERLTDVVTWLWCCVASACSADGVEFSYSLQDFADRVEPSTMNAFIASQKATESEGGEKKSK